MAKKKKKLKTPLFESRGAIITMHRDARGLKRQAVADLAGLTLRTYSDAERGYAVSDDTLLAIAKVLKLDFDLLKHDPRSHPSEKGHVRPWHEISSIVAVGTRRPFEILQDEFACQEFVQSLSTIMTAVADILKMFAIKGSTIIGTEMIFDDVHSLCVAFLAGKLLPLEIYFISVLSPPRAKAVRKLCNMNVAEIDTSKKDKRSEKIMRMVARALIDYGIHPTNAIVFPNLYSQQTVGRTRRIRHPRRPQQRARDEPEALGKESD